MKVLSLHKPGDIRFEDAPMPEPGEGEVLLKVMACGVCSSDEARIFKDGAHIMPIVPGHEFCGQVVKTGAGVDESLIGRKASVFPMLPCFECPSCKRGDYATCSNYKYYGSRNDGGMGEYRAVKAWNLNLLDDSVDYCVGALSEPSAVGHHATEVGGVKAGDKVFVIGSGTIGLLIGFFAQAKGAEVWIGARRKESNDFAASLGFKTIDTNNTEDEVAKATDGNGMDVVFEAVGSNKCLIDAIGSVTAGGTLVTVGNPVGDMNLPRDVYWRILRKQLTVRGTWNSSYSDKANDWHEVAALMKEKKIPFEKLITRKYKLSQCDEAFDFFRDHSIQKSRVMFVMHEKESEAYNG